MNVLVARLVPVAIVVFRYLMVCHAVFCQNLGGEKPLWRIVSFKSHPRHLCIWLHVYGILFLDNSRPRLVFSSSFFEHNHLLQLWTTMICLCVASGSLIFFTFDISATFLICTGKEERLRWHNANSGGYLGQRSFLCSNFLGHFQVEGWTSWFWESACTHLKRNSSSREPKYWRQSFQIFKNVHILNLHFFWQSSQLFC